MLTAAELADARADYVATFLTDSADVSRRTNAKTATGGTTATRATQTYAARLREGRLPMERAEGGQETATAHFAIELPVGTDVIPTDRIAIGGQTYEVTETDAGKTEALCLLVHMIRVT